MKKLLFVLIIIPFNICISLAQAPPQRPKLVVGIVIDQMRYDYVYKYWNKFGEDGFKKLVNDGSFCRNVHYNYVPTFTGPGHASIYTGTTPATHGIIANDWFNRLTGGDIYCAQDSLVSGVGSGGKEGQMSPKNLLVSTISDEIHLAQFGKSKVIGISLKDRGAIMPAGHSANAAYWFEGTNGHFISSSYYMKELPAWLKKFNEKKLAEKYLSQAWNTLLPIAEYTESIADNNPYEAPFQGEIQPVFPHNLPELKSKYGPGLIRATPFGNSLLKDLAIETIANEQLGKGSYTDVLTVSFSSTDYVGHQFGTNAVELEDVYIRLDKDLGELLRYIEKEIGRENVLLFLTADHGVVPVPQYLKDNKIPAGVIDEKVFCDSIYGYMAKKYGNEKWILSYTNEQVYFNTELIAKKKMDLEAMENDLANYVIRLNGVKMAVPAHKIMFADNSNYVVNLCSNGYNVKRSGNVLLVLEPGWLMGVKSTGTSHGTAFTYDTHVPLIFWGKGIPKSTIDVHYPVTSIAPTISFLLGVEKPNGCYSDPIRELVK